MSSPPPKRRKTLSPLAARSSPPHPRSPSPTASRSPQNDRPRRASGAAGATGTRPRIAGFDDDESDDEDRSRTLDAGSADGQQGPGEDADGHEEEHCAICLSPIENKTVVYPCHHGQFCWNCIRAWTDQSRKCPLCLGPIEHLIHNIRSAKDYQTHYLLPLSSLTSSASDLLPPRGNRRPAVQQALPRHALYGRNRYSSSQRLNEGYDDTTWREREEERALERRRYIYREGLYAKHVASNRYTGFKPFTPQTFANNPEMKAKVIKFVRRELQIFPTVDISFLTTYLISIASQLDLRSAAAIRLISDFLSDSDAQHLVHEITTFARSPFTSLEGYDRFVQYGRPEREQPKQKELEEMVHDPEELVRHEPRFAQHMEKRRREEDEYERRRPRPPPPMASLPPRPNDEVRRSAASQDELFRRRNGDRGYGPGPSRGRSRSPGPPPRRGPPPGHGRGRYRSPSPIPEPSWRDRDERYTGSYYVSSASRRDYPRGGAGSRGTRRYSDYRPPRSPSRSRSRSKARYDSRSPPPHLRGNGGRRGYSRSPAPRGRNGERSRTRSPSYRSPSARRRSPSPARSDDSRNRSRSPPPPASSRRGRSRSITPTHDRDRSRSRSRDRSPSPPPKQEHDSELDDAISLGVPSSSIAPTPRPATPAQPAEVEAVRPTLSIFGAARRILGNGNVVTLREGGGASMAPSPRRAGGGGRAGVQIRGKGKGKAPELVAEQEPYDAHPAPAPASPAAKSLLARLGGIASSSVASPAGSEAGAPEEAVNGAATGGSEALRAKLKERLVAEYRQALASRAGGSSSAAPSASSVTPKSDLRALLQSRLNAEKALAFDTRSSSSSALSPHAAPFAPTHGVDGRATFSQATRDLLMARLEEERLLALAQASANPAAAAGVQYGDEWEEDPTPPPANVFASGPPTRKLSAAAPSFAPQPVGPAAKAAPVPAAASESALRAALLAKRQAQVEDELKKRSGELKERLMRRKLEELKKGRAAGAAVVEKGEGES
ncbi:hypothetical protein JCM10213_004513 [Rhodosporidiobolus nylandii]